MAKEVRLRSANCPARANSGLESAPPELVIEQGEASTCGGSVAGDGALGKEEHQESGRDGINIERSIVNTTNPPCGGSVLQPVQNG